MTDSTTPAAPVPVTTESKNQLNAGLRYAGASAATMFTVMGVFSLLSPEQIVDLKQQIEIFNTSILSAYGALTKMWIILGPVAVAMLARAGIKSSSVRAMAGKLFSIAANHVDPASTQAKVELLNAAASPAIGSQGVVNKEMAANPATSGNVVSMPSLVPPAS